MPEHVYGDCPWCKGRDVRLYLVTGYSEIDGGCIAQYVCGRCKGLLEAYRKNLPIEEIVRLVVTQVG